MATGYQLYRSARTSERADLRLRRIRLRPYPDVIDSLQFERLVSASGPTGGEIRRPSDGQVPKTVVFLSCVGSRDNAKGISYCSKICCMYTAKHTMLYKHKVHDGQAHVFYMDIRSGGKNYDEFVRRAIEQDGAHYHRGRVSQITEERGQLIVRGVDTLAGEPLTIEADMVVLAPPCARPTGSRSWRRSSTWATTSSASSPNRIPSCGRWRPMPPAFSSAARARARRTFPNRSPRPPPPPAKC